MFKYTYDSLHFFSLVTFKIVKIFTYLCNFEKRFLTSCRSLSIKKRPKEQTNKQKKYHLRCSN